MNQKKLVNNIIETSTTDFIPYRYRDWTWLINPETKEWVVSVADSGYTFYNYEFFSNLFKYASLNCITDKKHIRSWTEEKLKVSISKHLYPDYHPGDYDWKDQFDAKEVMDKGELVAFL
jgi:hypothetical protein